MLNIRKLYKNDRVSNCRFTLSETLHSPNYARTNRKLAYIFCFVIVKCLRREEAGGLENYNSALKCLEVAANCRKHCVGNVRSLVCCALAVKHKSIYSWTDFSVVLTNQAELAINCWHRPWRRKWHERDWYCTVEPFKWPWLETPDSPDYILFQKPSYKKNSGEFN